MNIDFPSSPFTGQTHYYNNKYWVWDGAAWKVNNLVIKQNPALFRIDGQGATSTGTLTGSVADYTQKYTNLGLVGATLNLNVNNSAIISMQLSTSNCVVAMPTPIAGESFVVMAQQSSAGNRTLTFTGVKWSIAGTPALSIAANRMDIFSFFSDGQNWYGSAIQGYIP